MGCICELLSALWFPVVAWVRCRTQCYYNSQNDAEKSFGNRMIQTPVGSMVVAFLAVLSTVAALLASAMVSAFVTQLDLAPIEGSLLHRAIVAEHAGMVGGIFQVLCGLSFVQAMVAVVFSFLLAGVLMVYSASTSLPGCEDDILKPAPAGAVLYLFRGALQSLFFSVALAFCAVLCAALALEQFVAGVVLLVVVAREAYRCTFAALAAHLAQAADATIPGGQMTTSTADETAVRKWVERLAPLVTSTALSDAELGRLLTVSRGIFDLVKNVYHLAAFRAEDLSLMLRAAALPLPPSYQEAASLLLHSFAAATSFLPSGQTLDTSLLPQIWDRYFSPAPSPTAVAILAGVSSALREADRKAFADSDSAEGGACLGFYSSDRLPQMLQVVAQLGKKEGEDADTDALVALLEGLTEAVRAGCIGLVEAVAVLQQQEVPDQAELMTRMMYAETQFRSEQGGQKPFYVLQQAVREEEKATCCCCCRWRCWWGCSSGCKRSKRVEEKESGQGAANNGTERRIEITQLGLIKAPMLNNQQLDSVACLRQT